MRSHWVDYVPTPDPWDPIKYHKADVERLKKELAEAEQKLAMFQDPWFGLKKGEARVIGDNVYFKSLVSSTKATFRLVR